MNPLKPGSDKHPTAQRLNVSLAFADNRQRWQRAAKKINDVIENIPSVKRIVPDNEAPTVRKDEKRAATLKNSIYINANSNFNISTGLVLKELVLMENAVKYDYLLDSELMNRTMTTIDQILKTDLLAGSDFWTTRFFLSPYIEAASDDGLTDSFESAVNITAGTTAEASLSMLSAQQQLMSPVYLDRMQLVHGRVFESMKGLTGEMKSQLRVTLTEGVVRGLGIKDLKGMINKRLGVGMSRAERIARTEINKAYTDAYMNEADDLNETALADDDWQILQCHRSALSPTTRQSHAARHGTISTVAQQIEWWATHSRINCLCATLDVLVDKKTGEVLQQKMVDNMLKQKKQWFPTK